MPKPAQTLPFLSAISPASKGTSAMTELEYARKLAELDRLLNDPEVPMRPGDVWDLLAEISQQDLAVVPAQAAA